MANIKIIISLYSDHAGGIHTNGINAEVDETLDPVIIRTKLMIAGHSGLNIVRRQFFTTARGVADLNIKTANQATPASRMRRARTPLSPRILV